MLDSWSLLHCRNVHLAATTHLHSVIEGNNNNVKMIIGMKEGKSVLGTIWRVRTKIDLLLSDKRH